MLLVCFTISGVSSVLIFRVHHGPFSATCCFFLSAALAETVRRVHVERFRGTWLAATCTQ